VPKRSEINIFHFSFLDILFNTIGAITFMFMIFALMTNDLVEEKNSARVELNDQLKKIEKSKQNVEDLKEQSEKVKKDLKKMKKEIKDSKKELARAKTAIKKEKIKSKKKDKQIKKLKKKVASIKSGSGIDTELDPAMMSEFGESGGADATKINGQVIGANIESIIVTCQDSQYTVSNYNFSDAVKVKHWQRYFDKANQKIQLLSSPSAQVAAESFQNDFDNAEDIVGSGLESKTDLKYYAVSFNEDGVYSIDSEKNYCPD